MDENFFLKFQMLLLVVFIVHVCSKFIVSEKNWLERRGTIVTTSFIAIIEKVQLNGEPGGIPFSWGW